MKWMNENHNITYLISIYYLIYYLFGFLLLYVVLLLKTNTRGKNSHAHTMYSLWVGLSPSTVHLNVSKLDHLRLFPLMSQPDSIIARHALGLINSKLT